MSRLSSGWSGWLDDYSLEERPGSISALSSDPLRLLDTKGSYNRDGSKESGSFIIFENILPGGRRAEEEQRTGSDTTSVL